MGLRRSRDELLAIAVRRGRRMRRRRRTATALLGALALALPLSVLASLGGGRTVGVDLTAAGPAGPTALGSLPDAPLGAPAEGRDAAREATGGDGSHRAFTTTTAAAAALAPGMAAASPSSTVARPDIGRTVETTRRPPPPPSDSHDVEPPSSAPPSLTPSTAVVGSASAAGGASSPAVAATTVPGEPAIAECPAADVAVTVATEHAAYAMGEVVRGFSTLENRSAVACLLPTRSFFRIDDGTGSPVSSFRYTTDYRLPVKADPGHTVTDGFTWDQRDCVSGPCLQVPAGTYTVSGDWTEGGSYGGRSSFRIGS
ncbi:MAG TPA: hypothetical protein VHT97_00400 [Acidimicrobiales bacterium]|jgi:hypothetical protein|nr:hypothetical protein [Acidimicrobiales bacterium]